MRLNRTRAGSLAICLALTGIGLFAVRSAASKQHKNAENTQQPDLTNASAVNAATQVTQAVAQANDEQSKSTPMLVPEVRSDTSPPLRDLVQAPVTPKESGLGQSINAQEARVTDSGAILVAGMSLDTNGEVGATQRVKSDKKGVQIFDNFTGTSVLGPSDISTIWAGFGGSCETGGAGDAVVLYDKLADRWVISQFASAAGSKVVTEECFAVSTTSDATGSYYRYAFNLGANFIDSPHLSVQPDGYLMGDSVYNESGTERLGNQFFVFDRTAMLNGAAATFTSPGLDTGVGETYSISADGVQVRSAAQLGSGASQAAVSTLTINLTYDPDSTFTSAGLSSADITAMKAANTYAAQQFTSNFKDPINVNIFVTAVPGTSTLGQSSTSIFTQPFITGIRDPTRADATSGDDTTMAGAGGSVPSGLADPIGGTHNWWVTKAQRKALKIAADDTTTDGTYTFGGGFSYTYDSNNRAVAGKIDYIGVSMHEFSEIMGRIPGLGGSINGSPAYLQMDLFHYTAANTRGLTNGAGRSFSFDNGTSLLKAFNSPNGGGSDPQDWASGTNDAFNAFSSSSVKNDLTAVDLQVMDVIGYDFQSTSGTTRTLTVASSNPSSGVSITVSPNDNNGQGGGVTQFTRVYNNNTNMSLTAPSTAGGNNFQKWQLDGVDLTTSLLANFVMDANHTMTAVFVTGGIGGNAVYDAVLKAPKCGQPGSICDSGTLLNGRDNTTGGQEPNQPNTISNSCADGTAGTYHVDESIDAIKVSTLDGSNLAPGKAVRIDVTYWAWSTSSDYLDLFYAADASNPNWIYLATFQPPGTGSQVLTTTYQLPSGGTLQAVRAVFRYVGSPSACGTNSGYDDYDDLIFSVASGAADQVWVEDSIPTGGIATGYGEGWNWVGSNPAPYSGSLAHQSNIVAGLHNHYFYSATQTLQVSTGDKLFCYVYLDPSNAPSELMLQWSDGSAWHNVYWGADNITTVTRQFVGALPATGQWVRLEIPASQIGLEGQTLNGMAFDAFGGRVTWDRAGRTPSSNEQVWVEDSIPTGGIAAGYGEGWNWIGSSPTPYSGSLAHQSNVVAGLHNHYFYSATQTLTVGTGDKLFCYAYLDPGNVPSEVMLQWNDGSAWHNAYWGADNITTVARTYIGPLPATGQWVRLEVAASVLGLEGKTLSGMAFDAFGGRVTWDRAGKSASSNPPPEEVWVEDSVPTGAIATGYGEGWNWISSNPSPYSGSLAHQSNIIGGLHNHYFYSATQTLTVNSGDKLFCYVYLDPSNVPTELMLQWNDGSVWRNAYWGADNITTVARTFIGALPATGQWVRLEVAASLLGLEGKTLSGMAFDAYGGRVTWDRAGRTPSTNEQVWVEDGVPSGAIATGYGEGWNWISANPSPYSGSLAHQSNIVAGLHNHYFYSATQTLTVNSGDKLFCYVYLDPANVPSELMLQWNDSSVWHNAYWGADNITTVARTYIGPLPATGQWVRLEVAASVLGLEGKTLNGMAFDAYGGRVTWDRAGK